MTRVPAQAWAAVGACCVLWIAFGSQIVAGARKHDFLNLYTGASLALDGNFVGLHDPAVQLARERRFVPELNALVPFVRPHFYAAILAPLALIAFGPAFWVWLALQSILLVCCWSWALRRWGPDALIFGALYLPTALGIAHGQDCVLLLLIVIAAYTFAEGEKWALSGAALGLGLIKFHLFLLWPVALIIQRRWRMLAGFVAVIAVELLVGVLLAGSGGLRQYIRLLQMKDLEHLSPSPELMINIHSLVLNGFVPSAWLETGLTLLVLSMATLVLWYGGLWQLFCAAPVASLLVAPHVYGYDAGLLLLPIWLGIYCSNSLGIKLACTFLATPIAFMMTLGGRPWAATAPTALIVFLGSLAARILPRHMPQSSGSS